MSAWVREATAEEVARMVALACAVFTRVPAGRIFLSWLRLPWAGWPSHVEHVLLVHGRN